MNISTKRFSYQQIPSIFANSLDNFKRQLNTLIFGLQPKRCLPKTSLEQAYFVLFQFWPSYESEESAGKTDSALDFTDIDEMHLTSIATVGRINDDASAVRAETRMGIASPFTFVFRR